MTTVHTKPSVEAATVLGQEVQPAAHDLRKAPLIHAGAAAAAVADEVGSDDFNSSVAGEEDPGAALDLLGPGSTSPEGWCPWPRGSSA